MIADAQPTSPLRLRWPFVVMAGVLALAAGIIVDARRGTGLDSGAPIVATQALHFIVRPDGALSIQTAPEREIARLPNMDEGFVPSVVRGLRRERIKRDLPLASAYTLSQRADGKLVIADPLIGTRIELAAFGRSNQAAFAAFMPTSSPAGLHTGPTPGRTRP
jgi:putative photosynthetic complex assembly protein